MWSVLCCCVVAALWRTRGAGEGEWAFTVCGLLHVVAGMALECVRRGGQGCGVGGGGDPPHGWVLQVEEDERRGGRSPIWG